MAKQTLTVQLMHAQARIRELEAALGASEALKSQYWTASQALRDQNLARGSAKTRTDIRPAAGHTPDTSWKASADARRKLSQAYFRAFPAERSVTDDQLRAFRAAFSAPREEVEA